MLCLNTPRCRNARVNNSVTLPPAPKALIAHLYLTPLQAQRNRWVPSLLSSRWLPGDGRSMGKTLQFHLLHPPRFLVKTCSQVQPAPTTTTGVCQRLAAALKQCYKYIQVVQHVHADVYLLNSWHPHGGVFET